VKNRTTSLVGYSATVVGTCLMIPQILQALRTGRMADVSLAMVILYFINCLLWLLYGLRLRAKPITIANSIGIVIAIVQVILKLRLG